MRLDLRRTFSIWFLVAFLSISALSGCTKQEEGAAGLVCPAGVIDKPVSGESVVMPLLAVSEPTVTSSSVSTLATLTVSGTAQYERYEPTTTGGAQMNYAVKSTLPIRRAVIQVMRGTAPIASTRTDDNGAYSLSYEGTLNESLQLRVQARSVVTSYTPDGISPNNCSGGSWDLRVVNNVTNNSASNTDPSLRAQYAVDTAYTAASNSTVNPLVTTTSGGGSTFASRQSGPFALLDTAISGLETACQGRAAINFPLLYINWSVDNTTASGNRYDGSIATSFFTNEGANLQGNLYVLGKHSVDTDEFDHHVVAHEFGHYLENKIYRSDSIGGSHSLGDSADPRVAFGEGFGNAFSGIVHADPVYIDTNAANQSAGFSINVSTAPSTTDDKGPWSERSMQYLIYTLWSNNAGNFGKIHDILENYQRTSPALTIGQTFAAYYAGKYGLTAQNLQTLWGTTLSSSTDAFCSGVCTGTGDTIDIYDTDNDLGAGYAATRHYKQTTGALFSSEFWRLYRTLTSGANAATGHERTSLGGYSTSSYFTNKFGVRRFHKVVATSNITTVNVSSLSASGATCSSSDLLDMAVYRKGTRVGIDEAASGSTSNCPSVTFCSTVGETYIVEVIGWGTVSSYDLNVSP